MKAIVTGGGGFVGKALCKSLKSKGYEVISFARGEYPELKALGVTTRRCDISNDLDEFAEDFKNADCIFHTAAKVEMWGPYQEFYKVNVQGTKNLLAAAKKYKVKNFVYTSSPSVVADGKNLKGVNESYPYPKHYIANYPKTKSMAEQAVIAANSKELKTLSLRPHLIWGPGDTNLIPTVLEKAKTGKLMQIGEGNNLVDLCYIDDCVQAHVLANEALEKNSSAAGKVYFISQGEPVKLWEWINQVLEKNNLEPIKKSISKKVAYTAAAIAEFVANYIPGCKEPLFTRFLVSEMASDHYFDISRAKKELGYEPSNSIAEAMQKTF